MENGNVGTHRMRPSGYVCLLPMAVGKWVEGGDAM